MCLATIYYLEEFAWFILNLKPLIIQHDVMSWTSYWFISNYLNYVHDEVNMVTLFRYTYVCIRLKNVSYHLANLNSWHAVASVNINKHKIISIIFFYAIIHGKNNLVRFWLIKEKKIEIFSKWWFENTVDLKSKLFIWHGF